MSPLNTANPPTTHSKQSIHAVHSSESNHLATAVHQFKVLVVQPTSNIIRHTTATKRVIALVIAAPILLLPAMFTLFVVPFLLCAAITMYILIYGAEKTERDVKGVLESELGLGTEWSKGIEVAVRSAYVRVYGWFSAVGVTALDYLINVIKIYI